MAKLPYDTTDYGVRNKKISDRTAIEGRDTPTNLLANTIKDSLKKVIYKDDDSAEALVVKLLDTEISKFYQTNPILKDETIANNNKLYKCMIVNDPSCQVMPKIKTDTDSLIDLPGATMVFTAVKGLAPDSGNLVKVRFNNRSTSHLTIAGKIEEILNDGSNWEKFGVSCTTTTPADKASSAIFAISGIASTTVGKCVTTGNRGTKKVVMAYTPASDVPKSKIEFPRNPQNGKKTTSNSLPKTTSDFGSRTRPTSGASTFHGGVDLAAADGAKIYAALDGVIAYKAQNGDGSVGYGYYVVIKHVDYKTLHPDNVFYTLYGHLKPDSIAHWPTSFTAGKPVGRGQEIGTVGHKIGSSTGPHLHFSVMYSHKDGWEPGHVASKADIVNPMTDFFNNTFERLK